MPADGGSRRTPEGWGACTAGQWTREPKR